MAISQQRRRSQVNYHAGCAAEDCVARAYEGHGMTVAHRRWRGRSGELDLVLRRDDQVVFVEVKKSKSFAQAAERIRPAQMQRILSAGEEFIGTEPLGLLTDTRFDVALVNDAGQVEIIENALQAA
ncbi:YraN family protein [Shimia abyssi]|uniref:UPF0102 protein CLV88_101620 n=1 Tax=Shimia abyssi TaxID=1662395 RepID=A0A2P8FKI6_9RHOB|nr:YraN family protein [Shimia abyssi]PSL22195.1 putative endonuclease [Shimia abyssi]